MGRFTNSFLIRIAVLAMAGALLAGCDQSREPEQSSPIGFASAGELATGRALVEDNCGACHLGADGSLGRIEAARKTPEGWDMTVARMTVFHDIEVAPEARRGIVRYLSAVQGLAPSEAAPHRAVLERRHNIMETGFDEELMQMCARCHSYARFGLQRRNAEEWRKLVNMHVGQWPTLEYQFGSRGIHWWDQASGPLPAKLEGLYPFDTVAWETWKTAPPPDPTGEWLVSGREPGYPDYAGTMTVTRNDTGGYDAAYNLMFANGRQLSSQSKAVIYTGYEWRGRGLVDGTEIREVFALSADGSEINGRWFERDAYQRGGDFHAVRNDGRSRVTSLWFRNLRPGQPFEVAINGFKLDGDIDLGPGISITEVSGTPTQVLLMGKVAEDAALGPRPFRIGEIEVPDAVRVIERYDYLTVTPEYGIARVGGGTTPPVTAQFEAIAWSVGADGEKGTDDDIRLGPVRANWRAEPFNEIAEAMGDVQFAGAFGENGEFIPASAGPNPERLFQTNNTGDLRVIATHGEGEDALEAEAHLIVTVQKWNVTPIP